LLGVGSFAGMGSSLASEERVIGFPTDARQFHTVSVVAPAAGRRDNHDLLSTRVVAVAPVVAAGVLPAIVLVSARRDIGRAGHRRHNDENAIAPIAPAAVVVDVSAIALDIARHVAIYRAIDGAMDVSIDVAAAVDVGVHVPCMAACVESATASGIRR
jgi:hypothetical protein